MSMHNAIQAIFLVIVLVISDVLYMASSDNLFDGIGRHEVCILKMVQDKSKNESSYSLPSYSNRTLITSSSMGLQRTNVVSSINSTGDAVPEERIISSELPTVPSIEAMVSIPRNHSVIHPTLASAAILPTLSVTSTDVPTSSVVSTLIPTSSVVAAVVPTSPLPFAVVPTSASPSTALPTSPIPSTIVPTSPIPSTAVPTAIQPTLSPTSTIPSTLVPSVSLPQTNSTTPLSSTRLWEAMRNEPLPRRNFFNMTYMMERLVNFDRQCQYLGSLSSSLSSIYRMNRDRLIHRCSGKDLFSFCQENVIITFDSSKMAYFTYVPHPPQPSKAKPQLTFVAHTSVDRLSYLPILLQRWPGSLSLSIIAYPDQLTEVQKAMRILATRRNAHVVIYIPSKQNSIWKGSFDRPQRARKNTPIYPINLLRNLAILNVRTTHYVNMDMDLWPSVTLFDTFSNLPREVLDDPKAALILPAFQFEKTLRKLYGNGERSISQISLLIPKNKKELLTYVEKKFANLANPGLDKHRYLGEYWYKSRGEAIQRLKCLNYSSMEPYVILRRSSQTPLFHPYYIDYGFNKVQLVYQLRFEGFRFFMLMNDFGFDIPHPSSRYSRSLSKELKQGTSFVRSLHRVFIEAMKMDEHVFPVCS